MEYLDFCLSHFDFTSFTVMTRPRLALNASHEKMDQGLSLSTLIPDRTACTVPVPEGLSALSSVRF